MRKGACNCGKRFYHDKAEALGVATYQLRKGVTSKLRVYRCPANPRGFHLTSQPPNDLPKIRPHPRPRDHERTNEDFPR